MRCASCKHENKSSVKFCVNCGATLKHSLKTCDKGHKFLSNLKECPRCTVLTDPPKRCANGHDFSAELTECPYCPSSKNQSSNKKRCKNNHEYSAHLKDCPQCTRPISPKQCANGHLFPPHLESCPHCSSRDQEPITKRCVNGHFFASVLGECPHCPQIQETVEKPTPSHMLNRYGASQLAGFLVSYNFLDDKFGTFWPIRVGRNSIGRDDGCTIQIEASNVSRQHAKLIVRDRENGYLIWIEDDGSQVGTYHNNEEIGLDKVPLKDGDKIKIGPVEFVFVPVPKMFV